MTIDLLIPLTGFASFAAFLLLQFLFFRHIPAKYVFFAMVGVFVCAGILAQGAALFFAWGMQLHEMVFAACISWVLYGLLTLIYIFAVFGIVESSIRIRLLREVVAYGDSGISIKTLLGTYNRKIILAKRLNRFIASGDLVFDGKAYRLVRRLSFYLIPASIFLLIWKLYRGRSAT